MCKLNAKFDADSLFYSLSHFECNGDTVHMLTHQRLLPPLTSTVTSSLFMYAHSSPLSLAARLHRCHANCSPYINNGWTYSGQTSYVWGRPLSLTAWVAAQGPPTQKRLVLDLMLGCHCLKILNCKRTRGITFSFCTRLHILCSQFCLCGLALGISVELAVALFNLFLAQLLLPHFLPADKVWVWTAPVTAIVQKPSANLY